MIHELFLNIIGNALKYQKEGLQPEISIWQNRRNINGRYFDEICVTDNGIGFDMAQREEMLKPFRRLASAANYEGSGLGLAVCSQIMRSHGGVLDFSSKQGEGSTFSALFPLREEHALTS
jgi:signal transduction histidine kinase